MPAARPWKLSHRLAMLHGEERIAQAAARLKPGPALSRAALLQYALCDLRGALRIADVEREGALILVAQAYVLLKLIEEE